MNSRPILALQTNISRSNSWTFGRVCIDADRRFTSIENQSCVLFDVFCVGQIESSASWQAADPLLGQCLELIVTVRVTPIYTFSRPILSQWGLHCCRESHHELLWLVLQIQVRGATDLDFLDRHFFFAANFFPQNWKTMDGAAPLQRRLVAVTCSCDGPLWSDSSDRRSPRGRVS